MHEPETRPAAPDGGLRAARPPGHESPPSSEPLPVGQHNVEIYANAECWRRKPLLREIYGGFYRLLGRHLPMGEKCVVVEIGSGMGNIKEWLPHCITTDLFPNPWLDRVENAYRLSFAEASVDALILFDVWHHLRHPGAALKEWRRALKPGGRILLFEPDMGALGRLVYGKFHHEPLGLDEPIAWEAPPGFDPEQHGYYAAQGNAYRLFVRKEPPERLAGWELRAVQRLPALSYVASGGFRGPQLYPRFLLPLMRAVDGIASLCPPLFSTRLLVVLEKQSTAP